jgi:hypothetical protein
MGASPTAIAAVDDAGQASAVTVAESEITVVTTTSPLAAVVTGPVAPYGNGTVTSTKRRGGSSGFLTKHPQATGFATVTGS